jgi:hypothetical protein
MSWAVSVERDGENVVTIASSCLAGRDLSPEDETAIRHAAQHLLAFVGDPPPTPVKGDSPPFKGDLPLWQALWILEHQIGPNVHGLKWHAVLTILHALKTPTGA